MRVRLVPCLLALLLGLPALAQDSDPSEGGHGHAPPEAGPGGAGQEDAEDEEKGPNLQIPAWIGGARRAEYEKVIAAWDAAFAKAQADGYDAARADIEAVIEQLHALKELGKDCALPDYYLGIGYQITGDYEQAQRHLDLAIRVNPSFHEAMVELGDAHRWAGEERDAERAYGRAIETKPDYAHAYRMRAMQLVALQRFEEARADVTKGLEIEPADFALRAMEMKLKLVLDGPSWEQGYEKETRNYIVRTNVSQELCDEIAHHAELIRRLYEQIFPRSRSKRKSPIIVFANRDQYRAHGGPQNAGGHFDPAFKQLFLFRYEDPSDTLLVLYHEGFHQFLDGVLEVKPPQWLNEGLADYFGPAEYVKEGREEGMRIRPNPWRLKLVHQMIRQGRDLPFERLMTMTQAQMYGAGVSNHYAQAWSIVYFLCEADERAHFRYLKDYFKALRRGKDLREAYDDAFGRADMVAMQERWREFMLDVKE